MILSVVIPAYNEAESISITVSQIANKLQKEKISYELFVVNDNSKDNTLTVLKNLQKEYPSLRYETNQGPNGFGYAVRYGLERFNGDCVAVMMADMSDSPDDLVLFYRTMVKGNYDCVLAVVLLKEVS